MGYRSGQVIRAILFDKDGTLIDFDATWPPLYRNLTLELAEGDAEVASRMLRAGGMDPVTGRVAAGSVLAAGNTLDIASLWFPGLSEVALSDRVAHIDRVFFDNGVRHSVSVPGLLETLAALLGDAIQMGVATSDGTAGTRAALSALGLDSFLPHVFGYDSVPRPKPAPDLVHAFAAAIDAAPGEIAVVGDNTHDLLMARSAGAGAAIGVLTGTGARDDLGPLADVVLDSVRELPAWLQAARG